MEASEYYYWSNAIIPPHPLKWAEIKLVAVAQNWLYGEFGESCQNIAT